MVASLADASRGFWQRCAVLIIRAVQRYGPREVEVLGRRYVVTPAVFNPKYYRTSEFLARHLQIREGDDVLDVGTGSGILAIAAAQRARRVVAVDINPEAVECARANVARHGLGEIASVRQGNLFEALSEGERFDVIVFAPPYFEGAPKENLDHALYDPGKSLLRRFLGEAASHLKPGGCVQMVYSSAAGSDRALELASELGWDWVVVAVRRGLFETYPIWKLTPRPESG